jgi:hypothetical protein
MKICALLVPREMKVQHSQSLKSMSDEELDEAIAAVREMLDERAKQGEMIDVTPEQEQGKISSCDVKTGHGNGWPQDHRGAH